MRACFGIIFFLTLVCHCQVESENYDQRVPDVHHSKRSKLADSIGNQLRQANAALDMMLAIDGFTSGSFHDSSKGGDRNQDAKVSIKPKNLSDLKQKPNLSRSHELFGSAGQFLNLDEDQKTFEYDITSEAMLHLNRDESLKLLLKGTIFDAGSDTSITESRLVATYIREQNVFTFELLSQHRNVDGEDGDTVNITINLEEVEKLLQVLSHSDLKGPYSSGLLKITILDGHTMVEGSEVVMRRESFDLRFDRLHFEYNWDNTRQKNVDIVGEMFVQERSVGTLLVQNFLDAHGNGRLVFNISYVN